MSGRGGAKKGGGGRGGGSGDGSGGRGSWASLAAKGASKGGAPDATGKGGAPPSDATTPPPDADDKDHGLLTPGTEEYRRACRERFLFVMQVRDAFPPPRASAPRARHPCLVSGAAQHTRARARARTHRRATRGARLAGGGDEAHTKRRTI